MDALDDEAAAALRLALDDDLRALEALGDDDDGDGAGLGDRPSALLDRRLAEEFGADALFPACLLDGAGGDDDMEQMLLSESDAFLSAHFGGGATMDEMLRRLDGGDGAQGLRAELTARHFLHAKHGSDAQQQQRLVLLKQAVASATAGSASAIFNMPPRYYESATSSPQKRRAHRRTFGERQQTFAFSGTMSSSSSFMSPHSRVIKQEVVMQSFSGRATANDENSPPVTPSVPAAAQPSHPPSLAVATPDELVYIKEEAVTTAAAPVAAFAAMEDVDVEPMDQDQDVDMELETAEELFRAFTPVQEPFRSISDDHTALEGDDEAAALRTPLRRCLSSPASSSLAEQQQFTPLQNQGPASRSMSPADAFEKVAGVVQVARDSPARLGKFEWRVSGTEAASPGGAAQRKQPAARKRPNLAAQLGSADAASSQLAGSSDLREEVATKSGTAAAAPATSMLPPRYFRGGTSSPQKRRAHSTTFGAFARSFSFTGAAASDL